MQVKVILVDVNAKMADAWKYAFEEYPDVEIVHGSMLTQLVSAWVSPTNPHGAMDGGLDTIIKTFLGVKIEQAIQNEIARHYNGVLPPGHATCVATGTDFPAFVISTPTNPSGDVTDAMNVALACGAAFQAVQMQNAREVGSIRSVALPGLGASTGKVSVEVCADMMRAVYELFRRQEFADFGAMRAAVQERLGLG